MEKNYCQLPSVGFLVALVFLLLNIPFVKVSWLGFAVNTLDYVGNLVTPLSLLYIGIILADAGFKAIRFDRNSVVALLGRFIVAPALIFALITLGLHLGFNVPSLEAKTLIVQAATPGLAVLPILANEGHGDVEYATNVVTLSTVLFTIVVPILMMLIQGM